MEDYIIQKFEKSKIKDLVYLFHATNRFSVTEKDFERKFDTKKLAGIDYVGFIAYKKDTNEPAAFYGVFPCIMNIHNTNYLVAQSGDTVTHPNHQKKGLFILLANKTYDLCYELGIKLVYGFPNENSQYGFFNKLGWIALPMLKKFTFHRNIFLIKLIRHFRISNILLNYILISLNKVDIKDKLYGDYEITKNDDYFSYKKTNAHFFSKIQFANLWLKLNRSLEIGILKLNQTNNLEISKFKNQILNRFLVNDVTFIYYGTNNHMIESIFGEGKSFVYSGYKIIDPTFTIDPQQISFTYADIDVY